MLAPSAWAMKQWGQVQLGDRRRTRRAVAIGARMAALPEASLPQQMEDPAALKGAYRLLNHPEVTQEKLTQPHREQTLAAARTPARKVILFIHDTTELSYGHHPHTKNLGPVGSGQDQGLLVHSVLAVQPSPREVLGLAALQIVRRQAWGDQPPPRWRRSPEGRVWIEAAQAIGPAPAGVLWVHVADRGGDIFEFMATCQALDEHFLIRAVHNRVLPLAQPRPIPKHPRRPRRAGQARVGAKRFGLRDYARSLAPAPGSTYTLDVPAREQQPARVATLQVSWAPVKLAASRMAPRDVRARGAMAVWVVRAWEPAPPPDVAPLEWILLTSLPTSTLAEAHERLSWYACRPIVEDYHQCLKTGCRVERSQLDDGADLERLLGFAAPIAVRLLQLREAARHVPETLIPLANSP